MLGDKATEELAKLGQQSLQTAEKGGGWIDHTFGEGFRHLGGAFEDSMAAFRVRNRLRVLEKTNKAIEDAGMAGNTRALDPRISGPLLEAISDESDESLQDVWAEYIKNSVNPENPKPDRILIGVIRGLEPTDWPILQTIFLRSKFKMTQLEFAVDPEHLQNALDRMHFLGLFEYGDDTIQYLTLGNPGNTRLKIEVLEAAYLETRLLGRLAEATQNQWRKE